MAGTPIRFLLGDAPREIAEIDPTMTVLDYLRGVERLCGTKEGCAEGDCGACTVVLAEPSGDRLRYRAVNSCIQFVPSLHGKQLLAVEHLAEAGGRLHPCQQQLVDSHGSQCGFCTPGFVMTLFALCHGDAPPDRDGIAEALAGNLCRCTGYGPIIEAAMRLGAAPVDDRFTAAAAETLETLRSLRGTAAIAVAGAGSRYFAPRSADALAALLLAEPAATLLAGGTDVGLWVTKQHKRLDAVIYLGDVADLQQVRVAEGMLEIGAAVPYADLLPQLERHWPDFGALVRRLGAVQVRNVGTMGGNIANGSPIGDGPPALIALGARLVLRRGDRRREIPLEDFFIAYGRQDRAPGEFVERIRLPLPQPGWRFFAYKISKRFDQDITACLGAFHVRIEDGRCRDLRLCFGGMAATPKRAIRAEDALRGEAWSPVAIERAAAALAADFQPIDDMRASAAYRLRVAQNLLRKLYVELTAPEAETRVGRGGRRAHG